MSALKIITIVACCCVITNAMRCCALELKYYNYLPGSIQCKVCRSAALSNPDAVKELNVMAKRCVGQIQSEIAKLDTGRQVLDTVKSHAIELPDPNKPEVVMCALMCFVNTKLVEYANGRGPIPGDDGMILVVRICNIVAPVAYLWRGADSETAFFVHEMEMQVNCFLRLGEKHKHLEEPMRAIIEKQLKAFCEEAKKLQTAEDRSAKP